MINSFVSMSSSMTDNATTNSHIYKKELRELTTHQKIYDKLDYFHKSNKIPHIIFHGSSGSGKRTIVDKFLNKIYNNDKQKLKSNVMYVNCAHGKGIKFIREELKFFAKTNIHMNNGVIFKTIVLLNAEFLTIDAQSALRRCIELFSYNTRFFIIVENKHKLLNPILSRFCEIYVPEHIESGKLVNLHEQSVNGLYRIENITEKQEWIQHKICETPRTHIGFVHLAKQFYEQGYSCLDLILWIKQSTTISELDKSTTCMCFDKIKLEFRCEKLLLLYIFDFLFLRLNKGLESISTI
uniref:AAA+ ATPase domain-containing protein n=1 Tax=viral metagenome TaxID=1070528 RepID=A0A6C0JH94_9ZZZZ